MRPGSHASADGSFGRSAGIQLGRAALLIVVAVIIAVVLLRRAPGGGGGAPISIGNTSTTLATSSTTGVGPTQTTAHSNTSTTPTTPLRTPQDIKVLVANGTTTAGLAGKIANQLHAKGYNTLASVNSTQKPARTIVYFQPSYSADAVALAAALGLPSSAVQTMPSPPPVAVLNGANILVVVGPDLAGAAGTSTSTTAAG